MQSDKSTKRSISVSLDSRLIIALLLLIIGVMLFMWKPWQARIAADSRTIDVTGTATVKATPDEYVFYPNYEFKSEDKAAALASLTSKSDEVVAKLKEIGVEDSKIKTNSNGYDYPFYYSDVEKPEEVTYNLSLTVTVADKELAQKVQDYLVTTTPVGGVSPQTAFSESKRKELEDTARDQATQDARKKADKSAANLGFKVGEVKTVSDGAGFDGIYGGVATMELSSGPARDASLSSQLAIQPGENELSYTVTVTYFIK